MEKSTEDKTNRQNEDTDGWRNVKKTRLILYERLLYLTEKRKEDTTKTAYRD